MHPITENGNYPLIKMILEQEGIDFALFNEHLKLDELCSNFAGRNAKNGSRLSDVIPELKGMEHSIKSSMKEGREIFIQRINRIKDDREFYIDLRLIPFQEKLLVILRDTSRHGVLEQSIIQQRNETLLLNQKLEKSRQALEELSNLDELTQLPNRRAAHNLFHRELQRARLHHLPLSMIFLDMDNFKQINDFHGHEYGDVVLRSFAHIVRSQVRAGDIVTRWGGDEFVVMLADSEREGAKRIAALLLSEFQARPIHLPNGTPTFIEVSIGICQVSSSQVETSSLTRIIQTADQAMYISKRSGGRQSTILDLETLD